MVRLLGVAASAMQACMHAHLCSPDASFRVKPPCVSSHTSMMCSWPTVRACACSVPCITAASLACPDSASLDTCRVCVSGTVSVDVGVYQLECAVEVV